MDITLEPLRVTKEMILRKVSQEQLMEHYLGVKVGKGLVKNPLRKDKNPTASFYVNKSGDIIFKDFSGAFSGNFISVVMEKFQCSFPKALQIIGNDFGIIHNANLKVNKPKLEYTGSKLEENKTAVIQVETRPFEDYELKWWASYGISKSTLEHFNVYSCKNVWLNGNLFHLQTKDQKIFGYYGGLNTDKVEMWRIYMPGKIKYRFLSNWPSTKLQGAVQLPKEGDVLIIQKSLKDVMALYEYGITSIAPCSENLFLTDVVLNKLKSRYKRIIVWYDNDEPGKADLEKIKSKYPELEYFYIPESYEAKDFSDFYKKYGKSKAKSLLQNELHLCLKNDQELIIDPEVIEPNKKL